MAKKRRCWAECLGDCLGSLNGEHIVSSIAFQPNEPDRRKRDRAFTRVIEHRGTRDVRVGKVVSRMLCDRHNQMTGDLDAAGGDLVRSFQAFMQEYETRKELPYRWPRWEVSVNGPLVERWLMKIAINAGVSGRLDLPIGGPHAEPGRPVHEIVEMVFGRRPVPKHGGMWSVGNPGLRLSSGPGFEFRFADVEDRYSPGCLMNVCKFPFIVNFTDRPMRGPFGDEEDWRDAIPIHPVTSIHDEHRGLYILFKWPHLVPPPVIVVGDARATRRGTR